MEFYPTIITSKLKENREFYTRNFGFRVVFENDWYLHLISQSGIRLAFLKPDHPTQPEYLHPAYNGQGIIYNFEVRDVEEAYQKFVTSDVKILGEIRSEDYGSKHFIIEDPNGMKIDIFQEIEPTEEYRV